MVDDGSTDYTYNIARAFGERDPRIWAIRLDRNSGAPRAFNVGVAHATGKYLAHLAADDYWLPDFATTCVAILENEQMCTGVYTDFIEWHEEPWGGMKSIRRMPDFDYERLLREDYVNLSAFVTRWPLFLDPKWEPVSDWESVIRMTQRGPLIHVPKLLSVRRVHGNQITFNRRREMVLKSFLLAFRYSPRNGLWRIGQALTWPIHQQVFK